MGERGGEWWGVVGSDDSQERCAGVVECAVKTAVDKEIP